MTEKKDIFFVWMDLYKVTTDWKAVIYLPSSGSQVHKTKKGAFLLVPMSSFKIGVSFGPWMWNISVKHNLWVKGLRNSMWGSSTGCSQVVTLQDRAWFGHVNQSTVTTIGESTIWKYAVRNRKAKWKCCAYPTCLSQYNTKFKRENKYTVNLTWIYNNMKSF